MLNTKELLEWVNRAKQVRDESWVVPGGTYRGKHTKSIAECINETRPPNAVDGELNVMYQFWWCNEVQLLEGLK